MIERVLYDAEGRTLLNLYRMGREQALWTKAESLPELQPIGTTEMVPGTGVKIFVGERRPAAGSIEITLGTAGRTHSDAFALQREMLAVVPHIAAYGRNPGGVLHIAGYASVKRVFSGSAQLGGEVALTLETASPYFWQAERTQQVQAGSPQAVFIGGQAPAPLKVTLRAGEFAVTQPAMLTSAGLTRWLGTIPAGGTLVIDAWTYTTTLNGVNADLKLTGPLPHLDSGNQTVQVTAPGATVILAWREGEL